MNFETFNEILYANALGKMLCDYTHIYVYICINVSIYITYINLFIIFVILMINSICKIDLQEPK